jgi:hypothetical protein
MGSICVTVDAIPNSGIPRIMVIAHTVLRKSTERIHEEQIGV